MPNKVSLLDPPNVARLVSWKGVRWDIPAVPAYHNLSAKRTSPTADTPHYQWVAVTPCISEFALTVRIKGSNDCF